MAEIREDRLEGRPQNGAGRLTNGTAINGIGKGGEGKQNLAVPAEVLEEAKKITKECLDGAVELVA